ncbi:MAG: hypothetical protein R3C18_21885, partial [Planctomycetaceae bacterium]
MHRLIDTGLRIAEAMPQAISIDNFIDSHRDNRLIALCGKIAIAHCITEAERASKLFGSKSSGPDRRINFPALEQTWFTKLFQLLTENCQSNELPKRLARVAIVCFNYDRCIEHFLFHGFQKYYGLDSTTAAELLQSLEIHHPYGTIGALPWQDVSEGLEFGQYLNQDSLVSSANRLRTFTEGTDPNSSAIARIQEVLKHAERLMFLGFAYHRLNMQVLFPGIPEGSPTPRSVGMPGK